MQASSSSSSSSGIASSLLLALHVPQIIIDECLAVQRGSSRLVVLKFSFHTKSSLDIDIEHAISYESSYHDDIASFLPCDDCRYVIFNAEHQESLGKFHQTFFALWVPPNANARHKMIYASCSVPLKSKLSIQSMTSLQTELPGDFEIESIFNRGPPGFN